jgi:Holliday junction resolvasome RuvABC endonuclease subunit
VAEIVRALDLFRPQVCLIEDYYQPAKISDGWKLLVELHGVIRYLLRSRAPLLIVNNTHIKIFATGKSDAGKPAMILAIERWYHHLVTISDDNEADAFALLGMAALHYGHPLSTVNNRTLPLTHTRALEMAAKSSPWPVLNGAPKSPAGLAATTSRGPVRAGTVKP